MTVQLASPGDHHSPGGSRSPGRLGGQAQGQSPTGGPLFLWGLLGGKTGGNSAVGSGGTATTDGTVDATEFDGVQGGSSSSSEVERRLRASLSRGLQSEEVGSDEVILDAGSPCTSLSHEASSLSSSSPSSPAPIRHHSSLPMAGVAGTVAAAAAGGNGADGGRFPPLSDACHASVVGDNDDEAKDEEDEEAVMRREAERTLDDGVAIVKLPAEKKVRQSLEFIISRYLKYFCWYFSFCTFLSLYV